MIAGVETSVALRNLPPTVPEIGEFAAAWDCWRGAAFIPDRSAVELQDIRQLVSRVMVIEVRSPSEATFRLVGTAFSELFGIELTGLNYVDMAPPDLRQVRGQRFWAMAGQPCGAYVSQPHPRPSNTEDAIHTLCLPVKPSDPGDPMQIFCLSIASTRLDRREQHSVDLVAKVFDQFSFVDVGAGLPGQI